MKNCLFLVVIISLGLLNNIYAQQTKYRKAIFLHRSVGYHIYSYGVTTNVPNEINNYNAVHNYTGADAVSMEEATFPSNSDTWWDWWAEWNNPNSDLYNSYLNDTTYKLIIVKECFASQSDIWSYGVPADTGTHQQTILNYQWYARKILTKMSQHPDKFFVLWNLPPMKESDITLGEAQRLYWFNKWMQDTLATGIDTSFGVVPSNVYFFDYYELMRVGTLYQPDSLCESDSHPNAAASEYASPYFVQETFDVAITYESLLPVELSSFTAKVIDNSVYLYWRTETEVNNYGFQVESFSSNDWEKIGFIRGHGNSNSPKDYFFTDKNPLKGRIYYRLKQIDTNGEYSYSDKIEVDNGILSYNLEPNYPNPFNPVTTIRYSIPEAGIVKLVVYNILGQEIRTLLNENKESGVYTLSFDASELNSGIYIYKIEVNGFIEARKMILIR